MITIPSSNRKWATDQSSDIYGDAVVTKNVDFDRAGYLALAKKAMALYSTTQNVEFTDIVALAADQTYLYVITTDAFFYIQINSEELTFTKELNTGPTLSFATDLDFFQGLPHVSGTTTVHSYDPVGHTFTSRITGLSSSYPHPVAKHEGRQTFLVGDGNVVHQYDTSYVKDTDNELTIPADYVVVRIIYRNSNAYICTRNIAGGNAKLFVWNGVGVGNNGAFGVNADWVYSGCEYGSYCAVITSAGQLLEFNGAGFTPLANFPVYYSNFPWTSDNSIANLIGNVASRGMEAIGDILYMNINGQLNSGQASVAGTYLPTMPSGMWKYDPQVGLYHHAGVNYKKYQQLQPASIASNALVFSANHGVETGEPVLCVAQSGITNLRAGQTYYAIVIGSVAYQIALSAAEALAGKNITLAGAPNSGDLFAMDSYDTFGSGQVENTGPIFIMKKLVSDLFYAAIVLFAATAFDNALSNRSVLMGLGVGRNKGYFITPKIPSAAVMDKYQKLLLKYPQLNLDSDQMILKWRNNQRFGTPSHTAFNGTGGTFLSATEFTVDPTQKDIQTAIVGDEVEFINGAASGYIAHITEIDTATNAPLWTITVDETLPANTNDVCDFIIDNWIKYNPMDNTEKTNTQNFAERAIGEGGTWVQFKIVMTGRDVSMEQLMLVNTNNKLPQ